MKKKIAKEKPGFLGGMGKSWREMKLWRADELCRLDWILTCLILLFLFVSCSQGDIRLTGNRSFLMYEHFTDFYQASYEQSGGYWANYLPSTFIAYAVWNLPLYLSGHLPEAILTNSFINNMWYKLLPVLLYFATGHLIYKIGLEAGFGEKKSRLCKFAFLVFPVGVFSQFIFSQYDIFTVFFMILGLYFLVKGRMWQFALMFGIATTFKYQAVLYFLVFLLLKEKKIRSLVKYAAVMAAPILLEVLPNLGSDAFRRCVLGFSALDFVQKPFSLGFFGGINLLAAAAAFVLVWSYQKKTENQQELFSWSLFLAAAMSFAVFGFSSWNPQWLLLMVPFLVLNIFVNENGNLLVMITNVFTLALYIFCSQSMVDEKVLNMGIFKYILKDREFAVRMWDLYMFHDEELLCTAMWVVLLIYVVFGHPRFHTKRGSIVSRGLIWQIRAAFLFGVFAFVVPLAVCAAGVLQGRTVFFDNSRKNMELDNVAYVEEHVPVIQELTADGKELTDIRIRVCTEKNSGDSSLHVVLREQESGAVVYEHEGDTYGFSKNTALYSFLAEPIAVENGKTYELEISSDAPAGEGIGLYCISTDSEKERLEENRSQEGAASGRLQMRVTGAE